MSPRDNEPFQFSDTYSRFEQKNNLFCRMFWDPSRSHVLREKKSTQLRRIEQGKVGYALKDFALCVSAAVSATTLGTQINIADSGLTSWKPFPLLSFAALPESPTGADDPVELTGQVKRVARYLGADQIGIADLDHRWLYSEHYNYQTDESRPLEVDSGYKFIISMGLGMDHGMIATAPAAMHLAESRISYSRMAFIVAATAQFIRFLGYRAIPSLNDTGLNIPIAVSAGLGQQGRLGVLINPRFGPRIRLCKIITDMPLMKDNPIDFGVTEFCEHCQRCAKACPSGAVSTGSRSTEGYGIANNPGVLKWQLDSEKCDDFQAYKLGTNCTICMRVCPFNKKGKWMSRVSRHLIKKHPTLTPWIVKMDKALGYGKRIDSELFWKGEI